MFGRFRKLAGAVCALMGASYVVKKAGDPKILDPVRSSMPTFLLTIDPPKVVASLGPTISSFAAAPPHDKTSAFLNFPYLLKHHLGGDSWSVMLEHLYLLYCIIAWLWLHWGSKISRSAVAYVKQRFEKPGPIERPAWNPDSDHGNEDTPEEPTNESDKEASSNSSEQTHPTDISDPPETSLNDVVDDIVEERIQKTLRRLTAQHEAEAYHLRATIRRQQYEYRELAHRQQVNYASSLLLMFLHFALVVFSKDRIISYWVDRATRGWDAFDRKTVECDAMAKDLRDVRRQQATVDRDLGRAEKQMQEAREQRNKDASTIQEQQDQITQLTSEESTVARSVRGLQAQVAIWKQKAENAEAAAKTAQEEEAACKQEIAMLRADSDKLAAKSKELESQNQAQGDVINTLGAANANKDQRIEKLTVEKAAAEAMVDKVKQDREDAETAAEENQRGAEDYLETTEAALRQSEEEVEELKYTLEEKDEEISALKGDVERSEAEKERLEAGLEAISLNLGSLQGQVAVIAKANEQLTEKNKEVEAELESVRAEKESLEAAKAGEVAAANAERDAAVEQQKAQSSVELAKLNHELKEAQIAAAAAATAASQELAKAKAELKDCIEQSNAQLAAADKEIEKLQGHERTANQLEQQLEGTKPNNTLPSTNAPPVTDKPAAHGIATKKVPDSDEIVMKDRDDSGYVEGAKVPNTSAMPSTKANPTSKQPDDDVDMTDNVGTSQTVEKPSPLTPASPTVMPDSKPDKVDSPMSDTANASTATHLTPHVFGSSSSKPAAAEQIQDSQRSFSFKPASLPKTGMPPLDENKSSAPVNPSPASFKFVLEPPPEEHLPGEPYVAQPSEGSTSSEAQSAPAKPSPLVRRPQDKRRVGGLSFGSRKPNKEKGSTYRPSPLAQVSSAPSDQSQSSIPNWVFMPKTPVSEFQTQVTYGPPKPPTPSSSQTQINSSSPFNPQTHQASSTPSVAPTTASSNPPRTGAPLYVPPRIGAPLYIPPVVPQTTPSTTTTHWTPPPGVTSPTQISPRTGAPPYIAPGGLPRLGPPSSTSPSTLPLPRPPPVGMLPTVRHPESSTPTASPSGQNRPPVGIPITGRRKDDDSESEEE